MLGWPVGEGYMCCVCRSWDMCSCVSPSCPIVLCVYVWVLDCRTWRLRRCWGWRIANTYRCYPVHRRLGSACRDWADGLCTLYTRHHQYLFGMPNSVVTSGHGWAVCLVSVSVPACETDRPASSMSWSIEKAPLLMSSLSSSLAALAPSV